MMRAASSTSLLSLRRTTASLLLVPQQQALLQGLRPMTVLSKQSGEDYKKMNYTERMKNTGRPVSPHVMIYSFPIAALASITNRVTGCALSFGCAGVGALELLGGTGTTAMVMDTIGSSGVILASGAKFSISFTVLYHYLGAVRHFSWDYIPEMLTNVDVEKSSYYLYGGATLLSTGCVFL